LSQTDLDHNLVNVGMCTCQCARRDAFSALGAIQSSTPQLDFCKQLDERASESWHMVLATLLSANSEQLWHSIHTVSFPSFPPPLLSTRHSLHSFSSECSLRKSFNPRGYCDVEMGIVAFLCCIFYRVTGSRARGCCRCDR